MAPHFIAHVGLNTQQTPGDKLKIAPVAGEKARDVLVAVLREHESCAWQRAGPLNTLRRVGRRKTPNISSKEPRAPHVGAFCQPPKKAFVTHCCGL